MPVKDIVAFLRLFIDILCSVWLDLFRTQKSGNLCNLQIVYYARKLNTETAVGTLS